MTITEPRFAESSASRELARYLPALCRWRVLAAGVAVAWIVVWWRADDATTAGTAAWLIRVVAAVAALTIVFALDDPSIDSTRSLAATRRVLVRLRFAVAATAAICCLAPAFVVVWQHIDTPSTVGALLVEVAATLLLALSVTLVLQRQFGIREPAQYAALVLLLLLMFGQFGAARWPLFVEPGGQWEAAHWRWAAILALSTAVMTWQLRDAAAPSWRGWLRREG